VLPIWHQNAASDAAQVRRRASRCGIASGARGMLIFASFASCLMQGCIARTSAWGAHKAYAVDVNAPATAIFCRQASTLLLLR
jgi:hypothetical protein